MIKKVLLISIAVWGLQSCNVGGSGVWKNKNIDKENSKQIKGLNDKLFKAITNNDVLGVRALVSDKLREKGENDLDK